MDNLKLNDLKTKINSEHYAEKKPKEENINTENSHENQNLDEDDNEDENDEDNDDEINLS